MRWWWAAGRGRVLSPPIFSPDRPRWPTTARSGGETRERESDNLDLLPRVGGAAAAGRPVWGVGWLCSGQSPHN